MTVHPIYCSACGVVGLGAVDLPADVDPTPAVIGLLCGSCGDAYRAQLADGQIDPGQIPSV